jgi:hypothetical protein
LRASSTITRGIGSARSSLKLHLNRAPPLHRVSADAGSGEAARNRRRQRIIGTVSANALVGCSSPVQEVSMTSTIRTYYDAAIAVARTSALPLGAALICAIIFLTETPNFAAGTLAPSSLRSLARFRCSACGAARCAHSSCTPVRTIEVLMKYVHLGSRDLDPGSGCGAALSSPARW